MVSVPGKIWDEWSTHSSFSLSTEKCMLPEQNFSCQCNRIHISLFCFSKKYFLDRIRSFFHCPRCQALPTFRSRTRLGPPWKGTFFIHIQISLHLCIFICKTSHCYTFHFKASLSFLSSAKTSSLSCCSSRVFAFWSFSCNAVICLRSLADSPLSLLGLLEGTKLLEASESPQEPG